MSKCLLFAAAIVLIATIAPAHTQTSALLVGATVAPACHFTSEVGQVRASCSASNLRSLRVTDSGAAGVVIARAPRQLRAGGDVVFLTSSDGTIIVALDF